MIFHLKLDHYFKPIPLIFLSFSLFIFSGFLPLSATEQLLLSIVPNENSTHGTMHGYTRKNSQSPWTQSFPSTPVNFGKNGLAWGRGLHSPQTGLQKKEGDGRAPSGRFKIGFAMGYASQLPLGNKQWPYHQVTERDAWIDNPLIPEHYNHLYTLQPNQTPPPWFESQRKRLGDFAYEWKILIEHNYQNPIPGEGSAIFIHIRRSEIKPSFGCTVMEKKALEKLLCWLDPKATSSDSVLLSEKEYQRLKKEWELPELY